MCELKVADDLWRGAVAPEGILERWRVKDGAMVRKGQPLAELRIEDALHELVAPDAGRLSIYAGKDAIIEPGAVVGRLERL